MNKRVVDLMKERGVDFNTLATHFTCSKQTLTQKLEESLDWTFSEIQVLVDLFHIEDPGSFFYGDSITKNKD